VSYGRILRSVFTESYCSKQKEGFSPFCNPDRRLDAHVCLIGRSSADRHERGTKGAAENRDPDIEYRGRKRQGWAGRSSDLKIGR
jgi:hypothetical protein